MWECRYGKEPLNTRLFVLQLLRKLPVVLIAAILGALCVGGPYFLVKVAFGPAKEYEAVTDFYIDYALQENGEEYTGFNQTTWTQLVKDDIFVDRILTHMSGMDFDAAAPEEMEKAAGITKDKLQDSLYATMLSDARIVTATVTTEDPMLTMQIEKALVQAMFGFGEQQKEIAKVRVFKEPAEASLVIADVRTFRACMVGVVSFVFVTVLSLCLYYVLDESIRIPETFERRFGIPMLGTIRGKELPVLVKKVLTERAALLTADKGVDLRQIKGALAERGIEIDEGFGAEELFGMTESCDSVAEIKEIERLSGREILLIVKADAHNGKLIEKTLTLCEKCGITVTAALLWEADEKLIRAYEAPEHVFRAWRSSGV